MRGILIISLVFNLLVAAALLAVLERKGGWGYVRAKYYELTTESPYTDPAQPFYESTEYRREVSIHNQHPIQRGDVVFAGDSHVAMGAWPEAYPSLRVHNRGISGDTVEGLRRRIDSLVIDSPAALFISIGSNDVDARYQGRSVKEVAQDVKRLVARVREASPETRVVLLSALPKARTTPLHATESPLASALNARYAELARELGAHYIDIASPLQAPDGSLDTRYSIDGGHLNGAGYAVVERVLQPHVQQALASNGSAHSLE